MTRSVQFQGDANVYYVLSEDEWPAGTPPPSTAGTTWVRAYRGSVHAPDRFCWINIATAYRIDEPSGRQAETEAES